MEQNLEQVKKLARDLRTGEPRPPDEKLGGFPFAARCLDKCRAALVGWQGEFRYGCPMDRAFLETAGLDQNEFRDFVATGASDSEVDKWIRLHVHARA
ncbi:MAG: uncharacterized protein JWR19_3802 [Pedosphaera sp.]|nr:uncharacterized protein [Pedosphaera sp.]